MRRIAYLFGERRHGIDPVAVHAGIEITTFDTLDGTSGGDDAADSSVDDTEDGQKTLFIENHYGPSRRSLPRYSS